MTAALPDVDVDTRLLADLEPPCDVAELTVLFGRVINSEQCDRPARWVLTFTLACGSRTAIAVCDHHHTQMRDVLSRYWCNSCNVIEPIRNLTVEAL